MNEMEMTITFDDPEYDRIREEEETAERWEHEKYDDVDDDSILFR